jgi:hypothetical protein
MKTILGAALTLAFAAAPWVAAQESPAPPPPAPDAPAQKTGTERQFTGELVSVDKTAKTLTVKASAKDAKGETQEKTVTLPAKEKAEQQIEALQPGDQVRVLWRTEGDGTQVAISVFKADAASGAPSGGEAS